MLQRPPKCKPKAHSRERRAGNKLDDDDNKENRVIKCIRINSSQRAFGKDITLMKSTNALNAIDAIKKQSLSRDKIKDSVCTHGNYNNKRDQLTISECNTNSPKRIKQAKKPNNRLNKKTIEELIVHKDISMRNSVKTSKGCNSNSTCNINANRKCNANASPIIGYSLSQSKQSLTTIHQPKLINKSQRDISEFQYEDKALSKPIVSDKQQKPKPIINYPITIIREPYSVVVARKEKLVGFTKAGNKEIVLFEDFPQGNPQIPSEYINSIYLNLLSEEAALTSIHKATSDFMKNQSEINDQMRAILADWLIDVHLKFKFSEETLYMTISIIDRYISLINVSKAKLQLVGITSLMIACKHEEIDLPKAKDFIYITDNAYAKEELFKMEYDILSSSLYLPHPFPIEVLRDPQLRLPLHEPADSAREIPHGDVPP